MSLGGLYLLSFSFELRSILKSYLNALSQLENECLLDTSLTLSHLLTSLSDYLLLFPILVNLIDHLKSTGFRGCQILDTIRRRTFDGNTMVSSTMKKLLTACHRILIKQVTSILTRGQVYDEYNEFFIGENSDVNVEAMGTTTPSVSRLTSAAISRSQSPVQQTNNTLATTTATAPINNYVQYQLVAEMVPSYVQMSIAEKILFVGESWLLLKNNDDENSSSNKSLDYDEQNQLVQNELHALLADEDFNIFEFERIIERARIDLSLALRNLFVERFRLCQELEQMRSFYLMERGELFNLFIRRASSLLLNMKKSTPAVENDVNEVFKQCMNDLQLDNTIPTDKFKLRILFPHQDTTSTQVGYIINQVIHHSMFICSYRNYLELVDF